VILDIGRFFEAKQKALIAAGVLPFTGLILHILTNASRAIPRSDEWILSLYIATRTRSGLLSVNDLFIGYGAHRVFFSNLSTAIWAAITRWDTASQLYLNVVLAVLALILLIYLFHKYHPHLTPFIVLPFTLLIFSLRQADLWEVTVNSAWLFALCFFLLILIIATSELPKLLRFLMVMLFTIAGTFSIGVGVVLWLIVPLILWRTGFKSILYYVVWGTVASGILWVYMTDTLWNSLTVLDLLFPDWGSKTAFISNPILLIGSLFSFLGFPVAPAKFYAPLLFGIFGLLLFTFNLYYVWKHHIISDDEITIWSAAALYAVLGGIVVMAGRINMAEGLSASYVGRYITVANGLWIGLISISYAVEASLIQRKIHWSKLERTLFWGNSAALTAIVLLLGAGFIYSLKGSVFRTIADGTSIIDGVFAEREACVQNYPLTRNANCLENWIEHPYTVGSHVQPEFIYQLADYRLAIFADQQAPPFMPESFQPDDSIIINSPSRWLNIYIRDWLITGVTDQQLFNIAPGEQWTSIETFPQPLSNVVDGVSPIELEQLSLFLDGTDQVWYLTTPEMAANDPVILRFMEENGYQIESFPLKQNTEIEIAFALFLFDRP
jgi:hypothetical protein